MRCNPDEDRRFTLRLEDDLREVLAAEAQRQMRSLCSEIKFRLRKAPARTGAKGNPYQCDTYKFQARFAMAW
jgi:hypothetical protein